jgi:predicted deacylase
MTNPQQLSAGSKALSWLPVTTLASGMELRIPIHHIVGAQPGPVLGVTAGIHGDEYLPIEVVRRLVIELDPAELRGTILAIPVVNPLAFESQTRNTPIDMTNLNRVFPGDKDGWLTEQLAAVVCEQYLPQLEYLIDLHAGGAQPTVDYVYIQDDEAMSRAYGFPVLYRPSQPFVGTLAGVAMDRNIRNVVVEMGGGMLANAEYVERGLRGIYNVLKYLKMLPGEPVVPDKQVVVTEMQVMRPHFGGLLYPGVTLRDIGQVVPRGTLLGTVVNPYTFEALEELQAPFERSLMILLRGALTKVHPGDYAYMIGNADTT